MQTIAITGASGFIGKRLVLDLACTGNYEIRVLSRNRELAETLFPATVKIVEGSLHDEAAMAELLKPGCTVINLAYQWNGGRSRNLAATDNLVAACRNFSVARLIHCSTAAVTGRVRDNLITEETKCNPVQEYGRTKLEIEQVMLSAAEQKYFDVAILRPTAVFGIESKSLKKLSSDLREGSQWINYFKSCLFSERRMNLVHVDNVVAAIIFLIQQVNPIGGQVFIVSDDDDDKNNFAYVERFLMDAFGLDGYSLPRLALPPLLLSILLSIRGRNNVNPFCNYDSGKLLSLGFERPVSLEDGLAAYAEWYCASQLNEKQCKAS